jgi:hypothetical protein
MEQAAGTEDEPMANISVADANAQDGREAAGHADTESSTYDHRKFSNGYTKGLSEISIGI